MIEEVVHPALPILAAVLLIPFVPRRGAGWVLLAGTVFALLLSARLDPGDMTAAVLPGLIPNVCEVDGLSRLFLRILALSTTLVVLFGVHEESKRLHLITGVAISGAYTIVLAPEYLMLVAGMSVVASAASFQVWFADRSRSAGAGFFFVLFIMLGWMVMWLGFALRDNQADILSGIPAQLSLFPAMAQQTASLPEYMILAGACICAALVPAHAWLVDSVSETTPRGALVTGVIVPLCGAYILARGFVGFQALAFLGLGTAVFCAAFALMDDDVRRALGYASASLMGMVAVGIGIGDAATVNAAMTLTFVFGVQGCVLYMCAGILVHARGESRMSRLGGLVRSLPALFLLYVVGGLSLAGLPLTGGFLARAGLIHSMEATGATWMSMTMEIAWMALALAVTLKIPYLVFYHAPEYRGRLKKTPLNMYLATFAGALLVAIIGLSPSDMRALSPLTTDGTFYSQAITGAIDETFTPFTFWWMIRVGLGISGLALGMAWWTSPVAPKGGRVRDFQDLFRMVGQGTVNGLARNAARLDWMAIAFVTGTLSGLAVMASRTVGWLDLKVMALPTRTLDRALDKVPWGFPGRGAMAAIAAALVVAAALAWIVAGILV